MQFSLVISAALAASLVQAAPLAQRDSVSDSLWCQLNPSTCAPVQVYCTANPTVCVDGVNDVKSWWCASTGDCGIARRDAASDAKAALEQAQADAAAAQASAAEQASHVTEWWCEVTGHCEGVSRRDEASDIAQQITDAVNAAAAAALQGDAALNTDINAFCAAHPDVCLVNVNKPTRRDVAKSAWCLANPETCGPVEAYCTANPTICVNGVDDVKSWWAAVVAGWNTAVAPAPAPAARDVTKSAWCLANPETCASVETYCSANPSVCVNGVDDVKSWWASVVAGLTPARRDITKSAWCVANPSTCAPVEEYCSANPDKCTEGVDDVKAWWHSLGF